MIMYCIYLEENICYRVEVGKKIREKYKDHLFIHMFSSLSFFLFLEDKFIKNIRLQKL